MEGSAHIFGKNALNRTGVGLSREPIALPASSARRSIRHCNIRMCGKMDPRTKSEDDAEDGATARNPVFAESD